MRKIWLIFKREYISRVKNKIFWLVTLLAPLGIVAITLIPLALSFFGSETQNIGIVDQSGYFSESFASSSNINYKIESSDIEDLKQNYAEKGYSGVLYIPKIDITNPQGLTFYSKNPLGLEVKTNITSKINKEIVKRKLSEVNLDENFSKELDKSVSINSIIISKEGEKAGSSTIATMIGYTGGMIIYIVLLVYGSLVMQGVLEEKNSRVVEILISSVKPFELMMGKILGIALVGLTQFAIWIVLLVVGSVFFSLILSPIIFQKITTSNNLNPTSAINIAQISNLPTSDLNQELSNITAKTTNTSSVTTSSLDEVLIIVNEAKGINFGLILVFFVIYFLGGYLLYASLFAAIGSAINSEREGGALMIPVMMPIIVSIMLLFSVTQNPHGNLAVWASMIPFTSPIIMLSRIPFDVPWWQLLISVVLLYGGFVVTTTLAAKIYRVGILSYGIKPSYKDLWKWLRR